MAHPFISERIQERDKRLLVVQRLRGILQTPAPVKPPPVLPPRLNCLCCGRDMAVAREIPRPPLSLRMPMQAAARLVPVKEARLGGDSTQIRHKNYGGHCYSETTKSGDSPPRGLRCMGFVGLGAVVAERRKCAAEANEDDHHCNDFGFHGFNLVYWVLLREKTSESPNDRTERSGRPGVLVSSTDAALPPSLQ